MHFDFLRDMDFRVFQPGAVVAAVLATERMLNLLLLPPPAPNEAEQ